VKSGVVALAGLGHPGWNSPGLCVKLKVAWIGKTKEPAIQSLTDEYLRRLSHFVQIEGVALKDEAALLALSRGGSQPRSKSVLVLLDGQGKQMSSEELAKFLSEHQSRNPLPLVFAVGPADGFSGPARQAASLTLSLGKMTIAHELARVLLLEQLYRAFAILKNHPYHCGH
jgi:23S rRNA (pseudouridine1915-N3)-methyltransferase